MNIKWKTSHKHILQAYQKSYNPYLLKLVSQVLNLKREPCLQIFYSSIELYNAHELAKQDKLINVYQMFVKEQTSKSKFNFTVIDQMSFLWPVMCIYENRFRDLAQLIRIAEKQNNTDMHILLSLAEKCSWEISRISQLLEVNTKPQGRLKSRAQHREKAGRQRFVNKAGPVTEGSEPVQGYFQRPQKSEVKQGAKKFKEPSMKIINKAQRNERLGNQKHNFLDPQGNSFKDNWGDNYQDNIRDPDQMSQQQRHQTRSKIIKTASTETVYRKSMKVINQDSVKVMNRGSIKSANRGSKKAMNWGSKKAMNWGSITQSSQNFLTSKLSKVTKPKVSDSRSSIDRHNYQHELSSAEPGKATSFNQRVEKKSNPIADKAKNSLLKPHFDTAHYHRDRKSLLKLTSTQINALKNADIELEEKSEPKKMMKSVEIELGEKIEQKKMKKRQKGIYETQDDSEITKTVALNKNSEENLKSFRKTFSKNQRKLRQKKKVCINILTQNCQTVHEQKKVTNLVQTAIPKSSQKSNRSGTSKRPTRKIVPKTNIERIKYSQKCINMRQPTHAQRQTDELEQQVLNMRFIKNKYPVQDSQLENFHKKYIRFHTYNSPSVFRNRANFLQTEPTQIHKQPISHKQRLKIQQIPFDNNQNHYTKTKNTLFHQQTRKLNLSRKIMLEANKLQQNSLQDSVHHSNSTYWI